MAKTLEHSRLFAKGEPLKNRRKIEIKFFLSGNQKMMYEFYINEPCGTHILFRSPEGGKKSPSGLNTGNI